MHIAIIDDTPLNLAVMQSLVKRLDVGEARLFLEPEAGLEWCLGANPDLIIVDYMMPVMDGVTFVRRCREEAALQDTPILMVTAAAEREVRYAALEAGATDFLTKPIDRAEFCPRVRNMMRLRASLVALSQRARTLDMAVRDAVADIHAREEETVMRLAKAAEFRDPETGAHIQRMAHYSALIGRQLGLGPEELVRLLSAAPMHDVGKLGTPDHILLKPGPLEAQELVIMRQHAVIGYEILKDSASPVLHMAAQIAVSHHEKYDGTGYPYGMRAEEIPLVGRIVAVADVFDALTSARPYKPAWTLERARNYLENGRGRHFDPRCVEVFNDCWTQVLEIRETYRD